MVIFEGGVNEFDIELNLERLENFQIRAILAWSSIVWIGACVKDLIFIRKGDALR